MKLKEIFEDEVVFALTIVVAIVLIFFIIEMIEKYLSEIPPPFNF